MLMMMMMTMVLMRTMMIAFQIYEAWETDKIISVELWRNLSLCLFAVAGVSLILLGDIRWVMMVMVMMVVMMVMMVGDGVSLILLGDITWVICFGTSVCTFCHLKFQVDCDGRHLHPCHSR